MRIIIAMDIIDGKCVRLTRGDYSTRKIYGEDPLEIAREFEDYGIRYLHLVDLDGAKNKRIINYRILEQISSGTNLKVDFSGGLRTNEDLKIAFRSGARQVTIGSIAVNQPPLFMEWVNRYGNERIILGADFRNRQVVTGAWTEVSDKNIISFISEYYDAGIKYAMCTDVEKDGMMEGPSKELYREILDTVDINLIASGGISSMKDIEDIKAAGCEGVIVGKAVYEDRIKLNELATLC
jgi:phosphoribosylformimino-5-aminoimidazole carboxamide ribotide isomerase